MRFQILFSALLISTFANAASTAHVVQMKSLSYEPRTLEVKVGDSVRWKNTAYTNHSATADENKSFDTGLIKKDQESKPVVFAKPGKYPYHCSIHGTAMAGTIEVKP